MTESEKLSVNSQFHSGPSGMILHGLVLGLKISNQVVEVHMHISYNTF